MRWIALLSAMSIVLLPSAAASAGSVQVLKACVHQKLASVPKCIRTNGRGNADPCRTGVAMELQVECVEKLDPEKRYTKDPVRRQVLFDACVKLYNPGTSQSAQHECGLSYPPIPK
jgi:hypothetical protein